MSDLSHIQSPEDVLAHFGVKGMKWGQHKAEGSSTPEPGGKADKKWQKNAGSAMTYVNINNSFANAINGKVLDDFNKSWDAKGRKNWGEDLAQDAAYEKSFEKAMMPHLQKAVDEHIGTSPSGTAKATAVSPLNMQYRLDMVKEAKHSDDDLLTIPGGTFKKDANGRYIAFEVSAVQHDDFDPEAFIMHYGVKGMKWGKRKASGSGGPLTVHESASAVTKKVVADHNSLGDKEFKKKYAVSKARYAKRVAKNGDPYMNSAGAKAIRTLSTSKRNQKREDKLTGKVKDGSVGVKTYRTKGQAVITVKGGAGASAHPDAIIARAGEQKLKKGGIDSLSNKELQDLATRLNLERNVKNLAPQSAGSKIAQDLLKSVGKQQANKAANQAVADLLRDKK